MLTLTRLGQAEDKSQELNQTLPQEPSSPAASQVHTSRKLGLGAEPGFKTRGSTTPKHVLPATSKACPNSSRSGMVSGITTRAKTNQTHSVKTVS